MLEVIPAYGRDYKTPEEVLTAWEQNLDFQVAPFGPYVNKQDADNFGESVRIRFDNMKKVVGV